MSKETKDESRGRMLRVPDKYYPSLLSVSDRWGWRPPILVGRMADLLDNLDVESQQLMLGLPLDPKRAEAAGSRILAALMKRCKDASQ